MEGLVLKSTGSFYQVIEEKTGRVYRCRTKGKMRTLGTDTTNPIAVGDRVVFEEEGSDDGVISEVLERKNYIIRKSVNLSKQAQILAAEGRREAAYRDAEARERSAEAEAKATEVVSDAISKGNVQAINYFVANNYVGALKALAEAKNQKVLILPIEATSVIGAIAGVAEIAREAFGDRGGNSASPPAPSKQPPTTTPRVRPGGVPSV